MFGVNFWFLGGGDVICDSFFYKRFLLFLIEWIGRIILFIYVNYLLLIDVVG